MRRIVSFAVIVLLMGIGIQSAVADRVTAERIAGLPEAQREVWTAYLERSQAAQERDRAAIEMELQIIGAERMIGATTNRGFVRRLRGRDGWPASDEAKQLAESVATITSRTARTNSIFTQVRSVRPPAAATSELCLRDGTQTDLAREAIKRMIASNVSFRMRSQP